MSIWLLLLYGTFLFHFLFYVSVPVLLKHFSKGVYFLYYALIYLCMELSFYINSAFIQLTETSAIKLCDLLSTNFLQIFWPCSSLSKALSVWGMCNIWWRYHNCHLYLIYCLSVYLWRRFFLCIRIYILPIFR